MEFWHRNSPLFVYIKKKKAVKAAAIALYPWFSTVFSLNVTFLSFPTEAYPLKEY